MVRSYHAPYCEMVDLSTQLRPCPCIVLISSEEFNLAVGGTDDVPAG